jgi:FdhD protein
MTVTTAPVIQKPSPITGQRTGLQWRADRSAETVERVTPSEIAIGVSYDKRQHTVLMGTPQDVEDMAIGFTVTEAIASYADILGVSVEQTELGLLADVQLSPQVRLRKARPRTLEGRSSCGLCGVQRLADAVRPLPVLQDGPVFSHQSIQLALQALDHRQALGRLTRATHAAAFVSQEGELVLVREDVGRHNALDKLAGGLLRAGHDPSNGFILVTSRCSFEMVEKTVRIGCPMIVTISAPTDLAIQKAEDANLTLVALARADGHTVFAGADRLVVQ